MIVAIRRITTIIIQILLTNRIVAFIDLSTGSMILKTPQGKLSGTT